MWGHYLLTLYRSPTRNQLYAALNVFGLAMAISVFGASDSLATCALARRPSITS